MGVIPCVPCYFHPHPNLPPSRGKGAFTFPYQPVKGERAFTFPYQPNKGEGAYSDLPQGLPYPRESGLMGVGMACTSGRTSLAKSRRLFSALSLGIPP